MPLVSFVSHQEHERNIYNYIVTILKYHMRGFSPAQHLIGEIPSIDDFLVRLRTYDAVVTQGY